MASKTKQGQSQQAPLHSNPRIAKALAQGDRDKYSSMEAWGKAHGLNKAERRQARQVLRDAGLGVGRGRTYVDSTTPKVVAAARKAEKARKALAKQASPAKAQSQPKAASAPEPTPEPEATPTA